MDALSRVLYEDRFDNKVLRSKGMEFQNFFSDVMERRYPGDFQRVRPWGSIGDRKNDGYLRSQRTLYASYAPYELVLAKTLEKIDDDFLGALPYWKEYFDRWVFVHNCYDGVAPDILAKQFELEKAYPHITIDYMGPPELRGIVFTLGDSDIFHLLGAVPSYKNFANLGYKEIKVVLQRLTRQESILEPNLTPVSSQKRIANALSDNVEIMLNAGRIKSQLVEDFFRDFYDAEFGDKTASEFNRKYQELKASGLTPNEIFKELQIFAGGELLEDPDYQVAVLTVLAYFFDNCDIFERPREAL